MSMSDIARRTAKEWGMTPYEMAIAQAFLEAAAPLIKSGDVAVERLDHCLQWAKWNLPGKDEHPPVANSDDELDVDARQPVSAPAENGGGDESTVVHQDEQGRVSPASEAEQTTPSRAGEDELRAVPKDDAATVPPARGPDSPMPDRGEKFPAINEGDDACASVGRQMPSEGQPRSVTDSDEGMTASARQPVAGGDHEFRVRVSEDEVVDVPSRTPTAASAARTISGKVPAQPRHFPSGGLSRDRKLIHQQPPRPDRIAAKREAGHHSVKTVFDTELLDGRRLGDVRTNEYRALAARDVRSASMWLRLADIAFSRGKTGPGVITRELLSVKEMKALIVESGVIDLEASIKGGILIAPDGKLSLVKKGGGQDGKIT